MKLILTFVVAVLLSLLLSSLVYYLTPIGHPISHLLLFVPLCSYVLWYGYRRNGEYENSVGTIFKIPVGWIIPAGISFWFPKPIGGEVAKQSVQKQILDRSAKTGSQFLQVKTKDGGIVEVGVVKTWHIFDVTKTARFLGAKLEEQVLSLLDRGVRLFALFYDSDESHDPKENTALADRKVDISRYLQGAKDVKDRDGNIIPNDTAEKAFEIGIVIDNVDVTDVNEPKEVQDARNQAAAENAQAEAEKLDAASIRNRTLELMWGTSDPAQIKDLKRRRQKPMVSEAEALRAVRAARGNLEDINVSGDIGDFAKGAAIQRNPKKGTKT